MFEKKQAIKKNLTEIEDDLFALVKKMKENPELGFEEHKASQWLTDFLESVGFKVERGIADLPTAFRATYDTGVEGPNVAFLCEYDALPVIGHGCGHNMIGPMSIGGAVSLSKTEGIRGKITVLGCPAEETGGAKVLLVKNGVFEDIDVAMMVHPATVNGVYSTSFAIDAIEFTYHGKTSHAASAPELGINALDSVIHLFNGINALRQHLKDEVRIHGIISKGGDAANVVPELAQARFYFRAAEREYLDEMVEKIYKVAEGAALMTGASVEWQNYELSNDDLRPNKTLSELFKKSYQEVGVTDINPPYKGKGSTDMGNVSHVVPAVHPYVAIGDEGAFNPHSREQADATVSPRGKKAMFNAALAMGLTGYEILTDSAVYDEIIKEFKNR